MNTETVLRRIHDWHPHCPRSLHGPMTDQQAQPQSLLVSFVDPRDILQSEIYCIVILFDIVWVAI
jgi:hypothetical protein